jgi:lambda family phage tail tape measure protein
MAQQEASATLVRGQMTAETIAGQRAVREGQLKDMEKLSAITGDIVQQELTRLNITQSIAGAATIEVAQRQIILENEQLETKQILERQSIQNAIQNAKEAGNQREIQFQTEYLNFVLRRQVAERDNKAFVDRNRLIDIQYNNESKLRQIKFEQNDLMLKGTADEIARNQDILGIKNSLYLITNEEYETERNRLTVQAAVNDFTRQELKLLNDKKSALDEIQSRIDKAAGDPSAVNQLNQEKTAIESKFKTEAELLAKSKQGKLESISLDQSMSDKMKGFAKVVEDAFTNMGDAIVQWAQTGKLSGKELFTSLIADLARYELRAQMSSLYRGAGGLQSILGAMGFGPSAVGGTRGPDNIDIGGGWNPAGKSAKGGVYDAGLQMFAKGGTFTNSIVDSPTLFKFARGTGLMGEAGPEAIMPLKRDSDGNLGVRAPAMQPGNVEVVVHNYGTQQATTKESTDGRGNRRIEVIIGEAAAGEMARSGSQTQGTMRSTYGLTPQLIRR